jgi:hypothetical protein
MDMEKAYAKSEFQAVGNTEVLAASHPVLHMNTPLAHDIITDEGRLYTTHVKV